MTDEVPPRGAKNPSRRKLRLPHELSKRHRHLLADDKFRDLAWAMKLPFVCVTHKTKDDGEPKPRADGGPKPQVKSTIGFEDRGKFFVLASVLDHRIGMATILDWDIMIFVVSKLMARANDPGEHRAASFDRTVRFRPNDLLRSIRRANSNGGRQINGLEASLARLKNTEVRLLIGSDARAERKFTLLDDYHRPWSTTDEPYPEWTAIVSPWVIDQILPPHGAKPAVVKINPAYFDLGGQAMERVVARWAMAYRGYEDREPYRMRASRALRLSPMSEWRKFYPVLQKIVELNRLPDHTLEFEEEQHGLDLVIDLRPGRGREPQPRREKRPNDQTRTEHSGRTPGANELTDDITDDNHIEFNAVYHGTQRRDLRPVDQSCDWRGRAKEERPKD